MSFNTISTRFLTVISRDLISNARRRFSTSFVRNKQRVVILGSGWGGYNVLRSIDKKRWGIYVSYLAQFFFHWLSFLVDVTILSPNTYFNFTPLLAGTAVGTLEFRCTVEPVRRYTPQVVCTNRVLSKSES